MKLKHLRTAIVGTRAVHALRDEGFDRVEVRVSLHPAWTTDWITPQGRAALAAARPPRRARARHGSTG